MSTYRQRKALFAVFSKQLELGGVTPTGIFVCPLCREGFLPEALDGTEPSITLAHIIPDARGGKPSSATICCVKCNNGNGTSIESFLLERFKYEDWEHGHGKWNARLSGNFGNIGIDLTRASPASNWKFRPVDKQSNPKSIELYQEWVGQLASSLGQESELKISWSLRNRPVAISAAICQSAYLTMFAYFGYDFAFRDEYEKFREHIINPHQSPCPVKLNMVGTEALQSALGDEESKVMFVRKPFDGIGVFMRFRPKEGRARGFCVIFPKPEGEEPVPEFEMGAVEGVLLPRRTELLAIDPWALTRSWKAFIQRST